jgi:hypothetical protein
LRQVQENNQSLYCLKPGDSDPEELPSAGKFGSYKVPKLIEFGLHFPNRQSERFYGRSSALKKKPRGKKDREIGRRGDGEMGRWGDKGKSPINHLRYFLQWEVTI